MLSVLEFPSTDKRVIKIDIQGYLQISLLWSLLIAIVVYNSVKILPEIFKEISL